MINLAVSSKNKGSKTSQEDQWRAASDLEILMQTEEIKKDPKRLKAAKAMAVERYEKMENAGLVGEANDKEDSTDKD